MSKAEMSEMAERISARYAQAQANAEARSLTEDYKGCGVHINAVMGAVNGIPMVIGFTLSDWYGPETCCTYVDGRNKG